MKKKTAKTIKRGGLGRRRISFSRLAHLPGYCKHGVRESECSDCRRKNDRLEWGDIRRDW